MSQTSKPAPIPTRLLRLARLALHFVRGLWIVQTRYGRLTVPQQNRELERWSRKLLAILSVRVEALNAPDALPERCLLVSNHVSWLDIFAVYARMPGLFVAKSEIRDWPLAGTLVARVGTLFIERGSRAHARLINTQMAAALTSPRLVAVFPEGTTTAGDTLKHFHAALLQPAIDAQATLLPVGLRYCDARGARSEAASYVGETSLIESVWRIASQRSMKVQLHFARPIDAAGANRRELARRSEAAIASTLGLTLPHRGTETPHHLPAAPQSAGHPTHTPYPAPADQA